MKFTLNTPSHFRFWPSVVSHGWCDLPPFSCDKAGRTLSRIQQLGDGHVVRLTVHEGAAGAVEVNIEGLDSMTPELEAEVSAVIARCLDVERDYSNLYAALRAYPSYAWIEAKGLGRILSSPTVWEDLVKTLFTTNTVWSMTIAMSARVNTLGEPFAGGGHAFPTPERIASMNPDDLNAHVRAGYRGAYLHELALNIAEGRLDVESWRSDSSIASTDLYKHIKSLKGFGDYAAGNMLRLLGHFDRLATDSVCREAYRTHFNAGNPATDKEISAYYEQFGVWRGLAQWMDVIKTHLDNTR